MAKLITKTQRAKLDAACALDTEEFHTLLKEYAGIEAREYTAYLYYDEYGDFLAGSDEADIDDLLEKAGVEVQKNG